MSQKLVVTEHGGRLTFVLDLGSPEPIAGNDGFQNPLTLDDLEDLRWYLEDYLTAPFAVWEERGETIQTKLKDFGIRLFNALFDQGETGRNAYQKIEGGPSWELWLSSENPAFLGLPWELLWDPKESGPLALSIASINRTLPQRQATIDITSGKTLRVLMIISRPSGLKDVNYRAVARPLFEKLDAVAGKVEIDLLRPPTFDALKNRLLAAKREGQPYQILHFDGHGTFGADHTGSQQGYLLFDKDGRQLVPADKFGGLVNEADVPLVVLNACRSGTLGNNVGPEAAVATRLMQSGAAAVVAMGFSVYVRAAAEFMATFYESLFQGESVARAVARGRRQLRRFQLRPSPKGDLPLQDWCVPVHYGSRSVAFPELARVTEGRRSGPSFEATLDRLREAEQGTAAEQAQNPLAPIGRFVGRDRAFFMLEQTLGRKPVTLLHGVGGIGKTELAKAFALWLQQTGWAEGVIFHSFEPGVATFGLEGLLSAMGLELLGPDFVGKTHQQALLIEVLKQHRIVLVLDNFETVRSMPDRTGTTPPLDEAAAKDLSSFIARIHEEAESLVLITSRNDEPWLGAINRIAIVGLDSSDVHELADDMLAGKPEAQRRRQDKAFGELLSMLQGHPLSLRLLLPQLQQQDAQAVIADLKGHEPWSTIGPRDSGRLSSLDASVAYSLDQLDDQDRSSLVVLSLFEGVVNAVILAIFSEQEQVSAELGEMSAKDWSALLDRATELGLLSALGMGCYRLHPALPGYLVRAWRDQSRDGSGEKKETAELALIQAMAGFGVLLLKEIQTGRADVAMALIELQRRSMGRVLGEALTRGLYDPANAIMQALDEYWDARGLTVEADGWVERIRLAIGDEKGDKEEFEGEAGELWLFAVASQASRLLKAGRLEKAEAAYCEIAGILEGSRAPGARNNLAAIHHQIGIVAQERGDYNRALDWFKKSLATEEELNHRPGMASSYHHIGIAVHRSGDADGALDWFRKSLTINEELGNRPGMASSYHHIGMVKQFRGDANGAFDWFRKSLAIKEELGDRPGMALAQHHIGMVAQAQGDADGAFDWFRRSLAINEELGNRPGMALTYGQIGLLEEARKNALGAIQWTIRCNLLFPDFPHPAAGPAPRHLARLTEALGIKALESTWLRCAGAPLPDQVRQWVEKAMVETRNVNFGVDEAR